MKKHSRPYENNVHNTLNICSKHCEYIFNVHRIFVQSTLNKQYILNISFLDDCPSGFMNGWDDVCVENFFSTQFSTQANELIIRDISVKM